MTSKDPKIFAPSKVSLHHDRINAYLNGERIYPVTMELDLTQRCTQSCLECPYSVGRRPGLTLQLPFLEKLFSILGPHTTGIVLSGGEPTSVPHFPKIIALARAKGFKEIAVISNGSRLHLPEVQDTLLEQATSLRVSMYDWQDGETDSFLKTLKWIDILRNRAGKEGSKLEIGAAMLTRKEWSHRLKPIGLQVMKFGVDWLYFHPYCIQWESERPIQADQSGVLAAIEDLIRDAPATSNIQIPYERYSKEPLFFKHLHGSHFLIQVGADGVNYAGPECKYNGAYALLNLNE
ncbi:MAG: hypothetical protein HW390_1522 [Candidatus Brocadiaceae bacterium]|nr:hypothetical protein [Candidatus Brocadiaceae bacterium]